MTFVVLCFAAALPGQTYPPPAGKLELAHALDRTLSSGQTDTFEIALRSGQFIAIVAEEKDVKLRLRLRDPADQTVANRVAAPGPFASQPLWFVAPEAGTYRLLVTQAPREDVASGHYRLELTQLRRATDQDAARVRAQYLSFTALTTNDVPAAIGLFMMAQPLWHALNEPYLEAECWHWLAHYEEEQGFRSQAALAYHNAAPLWRAAGDPQSEALAQCGASLLYYRLGDQRQARESLLTCRALRHELHQPKEEGDVLIVLGESYMESGDNETSAKSFDDALQIFHALGNEFDEARAINGRAVLYLAMGRKEEALQDFLKVLTVVKARQPAFEANTRSNIANVYIDQGKRKEALDEYLAILQLPALEPHQLAQAQNNLGNLYDDLGDYPQALKYYQLAQGHALEAQNNARILGNIAGIYRSLGETRLALEYYDRLLGFWESAAMPRELASTLTDMGNTHLSVGEYGEALVLFERALPLRRSVADPAGEVLTLTGLGLAFLGKGENAKALENLSAALALARTASEPLQLAGVYGALRHYWELQKNRQAAILFGKDSVNQYQLVRQNIRGVDSRVERAFVERITEGYRRLADLLIEDDRLPEAERVLRLLKEQEFGEFTRGGSPARADTRPLSLTAGESEADHVIADGVEWYALNSKPNPTPPEIGRRDALAAKIKVYNDSISGYWSSLDRLLAKPGGHQRDVSLEASLAQSLLRDLPPGNLIVLTVALENTLDLVVVSPGSMKSQRLSVPHRVLVDKVNALLGALKRPGSDPKPAAAELYDLVVGPIAADLKQAQAKTIAWSLDGVLRYIPMSALYNRSSGRYLLEDYASVVYGAGDTGWLRGQPRSVRWNALALGVSKSYEPSLPELKAVPGELKHIVKDRAVPDSTGPVPGRILLNDAFTRRAMAQELRNGYSLVHIASHFILDPASDENSWLLLGGNDTGGAGYRLSLKDLRNDPSLNLHALELITLSACETAVRNQGADGREFDGLSMAAIKGGVKSVLATLWPVADDSTGQLMAGFYRFWTGARTVARADALRAAQLEMLRGAGQSTGPSRGIRLGAKGAPYSHPFYWASFVLMGNWQ